MQICDLGISAIISPSAAAGAVADAELPREDSFTGNIAWSAPERLNRKPYSGKVRMHRVKHGDLGSMQFAGSRE